MPREYGNQTNAGVRQKVKIANPLRKDCSEEEYTNFLAEVGKLVENGR